MTFLLDLTKPYLAYYSVPAAFALAMMPHAYATNISGKNYDLAYPRKTVDACNNDSTMDKRKAQRVQRAEAASANAFETLGMYSAGIAAAAVAGVPAEALNYLSLVYLASRLCYNTTYIWLQENRNLAFLRSLFWGVSVGIIGAIWIKAGNKAAC